MDRQDWFDACETLLAADPGLAVVLPPHAVAAALQKMQDRLGVGAGPELVESLAAMIARWSSGRPGVHQWYLDYRWVAAQEQLARGAELTSAGR